MVVRMLMLYTNDKWDMGIQIGATFFKLALLS